MSSARSGRRLEPGGRQDRNGEKVVYSSVAESNNALQVWAGRARYRDSRRSEIKCLISSFAHAGCILRACKLLRGGVRFTSRESMSQ